jgi:hypothetical protein
VQLPTYINTSLKLAKLVDPEGMKMPNVRAHNSFVARI